MSKRIDVKILTEEQRLELEGIRRETFKRYELRIAHLKGEISHIFDFYNDEIVEKGHGIREGLGDDQLINIFHDKFADVPYPYERHRKK